MITCHRPHTSSHPIRSGVTRRGQTCSGSLKFNAQANDVIKIDDHTPQDHNKTDNDRNISRNPPTLGSLSERTPAHGACWSIVLDGFPDILRAVFSDGFSGHAALCGIQVHAGRDPVRRSAGLSRSRGLPAQRRRAGPYVARIRALTLPDMRRHPQPVSTPKRNLFHSGSGNRNIRSLHFVVLAISLWGVELAFVAISSLVEIANNFKDKIAAEKTLDQSRLTFLVRFTKYAEDRHISFLLQFVLHQQYEGKSDLCPSGRGPFKASHGRCP